MTDTPDSLRLIEPPAAESLLPGSWTWVWLAAAAVIALAAIAAWWLLRRKHKHTVTADPQTHAMADALLALEQAPTTSPRDTATHISFILRRFLVTTTNDPALFETHEEFIARHDALSALDATTRERTAATFNRLASVKYAPDDGIGSPAEMIADARSLLHSFTPRPSTT